MSRFKYNPSREELHRLYRELDQSINQIAFDQGVTSGTVRAALVRLAIPFKKNAGYKLAVPGARALPPLDKELLERMYVRQNRSVADIAATLGCSAIRVGASLDSHKIPRHAVQAMGLGKKFLNAPDVVSLYEKRRWSIERITRHYGVDYDRVLDLLTENHVRLRHVRRPIPPGGELPQRFLDHLEQVQVGVTFDGKPRLAITAILSCGHKHPVHRKTTLQTDLSHVKFRCRACRLLEEKDHG